MAGISKVLSPKNALLHPLNPVKSTMQDWKNLTSVDKPKLPAAIGLPTVNQALIDQQAQDMARRRKGSAANILTGDATVPSTSLAVKQLLGG